MRNNAGRGGLLRQILALSLPSIVTNITTPLLAMTDVAIAGHLGSAVYIAAIAVGGSMFNMLYWLFGFLRMGSSGLTAQAFGADDRRGADTVLWRSLSVALCIGLGMIALQRPLSAFLLSVMEVEGGSRMLAESYFRILVWGAPASLGLFSLTGWFLGMQNSRVPMWIAVLMNVVNIGASLSLVYGAGMGINGLATGTLIAQWAGFGVAMTVCAVRYRPSLRLICCLSGGGGLGRYFRVNSDIFLRTLCLVAVTLWFTRAGAVQGDVMLAVNALLMQLFTLFSFFMDGFAFAGEALCGRMVGAGDRAGFSRAVRMLFRVSGVLALIFTAVYVGAGDSILRLLSSDADVLDAAGDYLPWAVTIPLAGFVAFTADGVFIGATATRQMLVSMGVATAVFFAVYLLCGPTLNNHGVWLAFIAYLLTRGVVLLFAFPHIGRRIGRTGR